MKEVFDFGEYREEMPTIVIDDNAIVITDRAFSEESYIAWSMFIRYFRDYIQTKQKVTISFKMDFYNTMSNPFISEIFVVLSSYSYKVRSVVNWYYFAKDDIEEEKGIGYQEKHPQVKVNLIARND